VTALLNRYLRSLAPLLALVLGWLVLQVVMPAPTPAGIILLGIVIGSLNALFAAGLVLIYKSSRVINFAQGNIGGAAAVLTVLLVYDGWNYFGALAAGLAAGTLAGGLVEIGLVRRLADAPRLLVTVLTIAIGQVLGFVALILPSLFGLTIVPENFRTPLSRLSFSVFPVVFDGNYLLILVVAAGSVLALTWLLNRTRFGVGVRSSAENAERAALCGVPVRWLASAVWVLGAALAAVAAVLQAPVIGLPIGSLVGPGLLLRGLAAAVLGRMDSLATTMAAAVLLSVLEQSVLYGYGQSALVDLALLAVILGGLVLQRRRLGRVDDSVSSWKMVAEVRPVPGELAALPEVRLLRVIPLALAVLAVIVGPRFMSVNRQDLASVIVIWAIVGLSLVVLTGWAGQVSLGQFGIVGVGAATAGSLMADAHADFWLALFAATAAGAGVAFLLGLPALRLKGLFLAVTTLAFGVVCSTFVLHQDWLVPHSDVTRVVLFGKFDLADDMNEYYFVLAILAVLILVLRRIRSGRLGRTIVAIRDNEAMAQTLGINAVRTKLTAFVISGAIAGLAGALLVHHEQQLIPVQYTTDASVQALAMAVIGGLGSIPGTLFGALFVEGAQHLLQGPYTLLGTGFGVLAVLLLWPQGIGALIYTIRDAALRLIAKRRGIVVSSLLADRRVTDEAEPNALAAASAIPEQVLIP
jgi:branched-chain amino acid transport system permease protein